MPFNTFLPILVAAIITFPRPTFTETTDLTLEPKAIGVEVVIAAYSKIRNLLSDSADDHRFLLRIAYVESKFGKDDKTFRDGYFGGIWQVGNSSFYETKNFEDFPKLASKYEEIQNELEIDWKTVEWKDLTKPLYSLLAAYLKLVTIGLRVPQNVADQSRFWKMHYTEEIRDRLEFVNDIRKLEDCRTSRIKCRIDLVIVLDGSGSIGQTEFEKAKSFVHELLECLPFETANTGLLIYSEEVDTIFDLETDLTPEEKSVLILNAKYPGLGTNTHLGMRLGIDWAEKRQANNNDALPLVMIVLTDGHSSQPTETSRASISAGDLGISTFAIGVGPHIRRRELKLIAGQPNNNGEQVMQINSYKTLSDLLGQIQITVCSTARKLKREIRFQDNVRQNEVSYYAAQVPENGITLMVETPLGKTKGFYSFSLKTPSFAFNDGIINEGLNYIPAPKNKSSNNQHHYIKIRSKRGIPRTRRHWHHYLENSENLNAIHAKYQTRNHNNDVNPNQGEKRQVYIAIEGMQQTNNFTIEIEENLTPTTSTTTPVPKSTSTEISNPDSDSDSQIDDFDLDVLEIQVPDTDHDSETKIKFQNSSIEIFETPKSISSSSLSSICTYNIMVLCVYILVQIIC